VHDGYHTPVLVDAVVRWLDPARGGVYFDGTLGGGGHSEAILEAGPDVRVIAADRDPEAVAEARDRLAGYGGRFEARQGDYADVAEGLEVELAGALLDLGISSHQIDVDRRGFSFRPGNPLDMRMSGSGRTAAEVLNTYGEEELLRVLWDYGEEKRARAIVRRILQRRRDLPFELSEHLVSVLEEVYRHRLTPQDKARVFQALRIEVNDEMGSLDRALEVLREKLAPGGVFVVIAYHSLEDRRVKNAFREWSRSCVCPPDLPVCVCRGEPLGTTLTPKVVRPEEEEVEENPRSRSARLRAWRRKAE
jgi:16S rRNA (cytosine1402-N4)-methyltransferase